MQTSVAVIGGTGAEGRGLALRFARSGMRVLIGSRSADKAREHAAGIAASAGAGDVEGHSNEYAAAGSRIVVLTVPLPAQAGIVKSIRDALRQDAIVVDATVPLEIAIGGRVSRMLTLWDGSAAQQAARVLGGKARVVAAFHSLSAEALAKSEDPLDCDTLICGDDDEAKSAVSELAVKIPGVRPIDAGPLDNARYLESAAALLISLNLRYKVKASGYRITGLPEGVVK